MSETESTTQNVMHRAIMYMECIIMHKHVYLTILSRGLPLWKKDLHLGLQFLIQRFKFCYELETQNNKRLLDFKNNIKNEKANNQKSHNKEEIRQWLHLAAWVMDLGNIFVGKNPTNT